MPDSLTTEPELPFVCDCEEGMRTACAGQPFFEEHKDKRYCVLHYPVDSKRKEFKIAVTTKLNSNDHDFSGVWFPDPVSFKDPLTNAHFGYATFCADADFSHVNFGYIAGFAGTIFLGKANFEGARSGLMCFNQSQFHDDAIFSNAEFLKAEFYSAHFRGLADFSYAELGSKTGGPFSGEAYFVGATFDSLADFESTQFHGRADFMSALFEGRANFHGAIFQGSAQFVWATLNAEVQFGFEIERGHAFQSELDLEFATSCSPERIRFTNVTLRPGWFVNVTARRFDFRNVQWDWKSDIVLRRLSWAQLLGARSPVQEESRRLLDRSALWEKGALSVAYRELALNAEENHRYEEASKFRYMAMDCRRREKWRGFAFWRLSWWYWLASGYGERAAQAFLILLGILVLSALLYAQVGFVRWEPRLASESDAAVAARDGIGAPLPLPRALAYSAAVMTFQKPEPRPATTAAQTAVLLETILGPVQAALLALAIRRKFMR